MKTKHLRKLDMMDSTSESLLNSKVWEGMKIISHCLMADFSISIVVGFESLRTSLVVDPSLKIPDEVLEKAGYDIARAYVGRGPEWNEWRVRFAGKLTVVHFCRRIRGQFRSTIIPSYPLLEQSIERRGAHRVVTKAIYKALEHMPADDIYQILDKAIIKSDMEA